jgi:hypothetical protein
MSLNSLSSHMMSYQRNHKKPRKTKTSFSRSPNSSEEIQLSENEENNKEEEKNQNSMHLQEENDHTDSTESSQNEQIITPEDAIIIREAKENTRHFSKIAIRFKFENNTPSYLAWKIQFKAEYSDQNSK